MHISLSDARNDALTVYVDGALVPRNEAKVSVFDSVVQGGDAVWEGLPSPHKYCLTASAY